MKKFLSIFALLLTLTSVAQAQTYPNTPTLSATDQITVYNPANSTNNSQNTKMRSFNPPQLLRDSMGVPTPTDSALWGFDIDDGKYQPFDFGSNLTAVENVVDTTIPPAILVAGLPNTLTSGACNHIVNVTAATGTLTVPAANVTGFTQGCGITINAAPTAGTITVTSPSNFSGSASIVLAPSTGCTINSNSTNWEIDFSACSAAAAGSVKSVSVASANGFSGSVANPTSTPAITILATPNGILKSNGTVMSAATAGTDYSAGTSALATGILKSTTSTGALSIAVAADFPTLNQNTTGNAATVTTIPTLSGDVTNAGNAVTVTNAAVIGKLLTGYSASAGTVAATDSILQAFNKTQGNIALRAPLASPTFTGTVTIPTTSGILKTTAGVIGAATVGTDYVSPSNAQTYTAQQNFGTAALTDGTNIAWNLNTQQVASVTLGGNRTLDNPTNQVNGGTYILRITQDATGSRTLAYGTNYKFPGGTVPVLTTAANAVDIMTCISTGTLMNCVTQKDFK